MQKEELILAALASSGREVYTPIQVQKMMFLIDKKLSDFIGGPYFDFVPYSYGPFDVGIYYSLNKLELEGDVEAVRIPQVAWSKYQLTKQGQEKGEQILNSMETKVSEYVKQLSSFVRSLSFSELVSAIYKEYPEMKINSVFKD